MKSISFGSVAALALSLSLSAQSGTVATAYEQLLAGANDLSGLAFTFTPNAQGGYDITPTGAFDNNFSNVVSFGDDDLQSGFALGFTVNIPGSGPVSSMQIDSNGWVAPDGAFSASDFGESPTEMESQGTRIAMLWDDLSPNNNGAVYVDNFPGLWLVTFDQVPQFSNTGANTFQLQMRADGSFTIAYGVVEADCIAGFSYGAGQAASQIDLTMDLPFSTIGGLGSFATFGQGCPNEILSAYEDIDNGFSDLGTAVTGYTLTPNAAGGYDISTGGAIVPGWTNNLGLGDDVLSDANPLGFTINVPGAGMVSAIDISSNGWCAPDSAATSSEAFETTAAMNDGQTRFAGIWDDLNPGSAGGVYFDAGPGVAIVTWDGVPQFNITTAFSTFQVQFYNNGTVVIAYGTVDPNIDGISGFSFGGGAPAQILDLSMDLPFSTGSNLPAAHTLSANPAIGTTVDLELSDLPASSPAAAIVVGISQLAVDLTAIGMPGCFQHTETFLFLDCPAPVAGATAFSLPIPNDPNLLGASFVTQGVAVAPGVNTLSVVTSNGAQVNVGN